MPDADNPNLSIRQLQCVVSLARYGSFIAAAADVGISQPTLTRTIKQVEDSLGVRLFTRSTRRVALTAAGEEFAPVAQRLIGDFRISVQNMRALGDRRRGRLLVACQMSLAYGLLPDIIAEYRNRHRGVDLEIREGVQSAVHDDIRSGLADIGIADMTDIHPSIDAQLLFEEGFYVVLPPDHRLASRRSLRMAQFNEDTLIMMPFGAGIRRLIEGAAAAAGMTFAQTLTVSQFATTFNLVRAGVGVSIVPGAALRPEAEHGLVARRLVQPKITRRLGLMRLRERPLSPAAEGFVDILRQRFRRRRHR